MYRHLTNHELFNAIYAEPRNEALRDELVNRVLQGLL